MKNYRILRKMLEESGFVLVKDGNHCIFAKNGKTVLVTKNIRDPKTIFKRTVKYYEQS